MNIDNIIQFIVDNSDPEVVALGGMPDIPPHIQSFSATIVEECIEQFGDEASLEDWKCSRERYTATLSMAAKYLGTGSDILVAYDGKGYLSLMLDRAGYNVTRMIPSAHWCDEQLRSGWRSGMRLETCNLDEVAFPFPDGSLDCIVISGVFERLALRHPRSVMTELHRVLRDDGVILFSTPNICNISNVISLIKGNNIFWNSEIFFGGMDRHNREFTPAEIQDLFFEGGFVTKEFFGVTDHANWRSGSAHHVYDYQSAHGDIDHPLMRNTILGIFAKMND